MALVECGQYVVLMKTFDSGNTKFVQALPETIAHYGKLHFDTTPLIGSPYGSVFQIKDKTMIRVQDFKSFELGLESSVSENSATFDDKSQFSKEKIIKKKKKLIHANVLTVTKPSLVLLHETYFGRDKLGGLRSDVLSQILTFSNIQNGSKCLLLDHNLGLVTAAVMSRILPNGICVQLIQDNEVRLTTRRSLEMLNISEQDSNQNLLAVTIRDLYKIKNDCEQFAYENTVLKAKVSQHLAKLADPQYHPEGVELAKGPVKRRLDESERETVKQQLINKDTNRELRHQERAKAISYLKLFSLDSIILVVQNDHPLPILKMCYTYLSPSRNFVIYSDIIEPLLECYDYLKSNSMAISMSLTDSWLRKYQVLPDRTRPEMNTSGYGGYLLSGIKVLMEP